MPGKVRRSFAVKFGTQKKAAPKRLHFQIDCTVPVNHGLFDTEAFKNFLTERVKVNGKTKALGDIVVISLKNNTVSVNAQAPFSKRYLKYLTKKYLKKAQLRDWLRVIATGKNTYQLKFFNIRDGEDAEDAE